MVIWFYSVIFILSLAMTAGFVLKHNNVNTVFMVFSVLVNLNALGRVIIATSTTLETALIGNGFLYVGACYSPVLVAKILTRLSNIRLNHYVLAFMLMYSTVVFGFTMTIGRTNHYYEEVSLGLGDGYSYLIKTYGPFHKLYPTMLVVYGSILLVYMILSLKNKTKVSYKTILVIGSLCLGIIVVYILERLMKTSISYLSTGYLFGIILLTRHFEHVNMYDISTNIVNSIEKMKEYGYIVLDKNKRFVSANDYIKEVFPYIKQWEVDKEIPASDRPAYHLVKDYLDNIDSEVGKRKMIEAGDRHFQLEIRILEYWRNKKIGYLLEFVDRTMEKKYYKTIEEYNEILAEEVAEKTEDILRMKDMMVLGMAELLEGRDDNTGGHIKRTSHVVRILVETIQENNMLLLDRRFCKDIIKAAPMHDLGKIAIDDKILKKPGKLTEEEFEIIKTHSERSAVLVERILKGIEEESFIRVAVNVARYHHEKWNGTGYPEGLRGTDIPLEARIMAIADVYDALVSRRCYKKEMSFEEANKVMMKSMGTHFDPALEGAFIRSRKKLESYYEGFSDLEEVT